MGDSGVRAKSLKLVDLALLCDAHYRQAIGLAYALLADTVLAEYAVEEALLAAWRVGAASAVGTEATRLLLRGLVIRQAAGLQLHAPPPAAKATATGYPQRRRRNGPTRRRHSGRRGFLH